MILNKFLELYDKTLHHPTRLYHTKSILYDKINTYIGGKIWEHQVGKKYLGYKMN